MELLLVGWDGATFDLIKPLVDDGRLPTVSSLMRNGSWGRLESTIPALTPTAWTSISTGVNPGKHGIFDGFAHSRSERRINFVNASYRRVKPVWSILSECGKKAGVLNVPVTYPPERTCEFIIPGMFTPHVLPHFMHPRHLHAELEKRFGRYQVEYSEPADPSTHLGLILDMIATREKVALYLMEHHPVDFFFVAFMASDRVQHFFWKYMNSSSTDSGEFRNAITRVYERLDQSLELLIQKAGPDATVMMVSDHGAGPLKHAFFLNNWLLQNGYLQLIVDPKKFFSTRQRLDFKSLAVELIRKYAPYAIIEKLKTIKARSIERDINLFLSLIDWKSTRAFSEGLAGGIFINNSIVDPSQYNALRHELMEKLKKVVGPDGKQVVKEVHRREDVYQGPCVNEAPDLILTCGEGYHIISPAEFFRTRSTYEETLFLDHRWSARHEPHGIFILKGPNSSKGTQLDRVSVVDVAPMALYLMGESIPEYMDGHVVPGAVDAHFYENHVIRKNGGTAEAQGGPQVALSAEEERKIADTLEDLGYM